MKFDTLETGNVKAAMKDNGATRSDLWMVPFDQLRVMDGFNVRQHDADYEAHLAWLTDRMVERGYDRSKPMTGYVVKEDGKDVVCITDGHSRHAAVGRALLRGAAIAFVPVITHPAGTSADDIVASLVTANTGKALKPYEVAQVILRLQGYGHDEGEIAKRLGLTRPYVVGLLSLLAAPKPVRDLVSTGKVSATLAIETMRENGKGAAAILKAAVGKAEAEGKTKATKRDVATKPRKTLADTITDAQIEAIHTAFWAAVSQGRGDERFAAAREALR